MLLEDQDDTIVDTIPEGELILDLLEEPLEEKLPLSRPERYLSEFKKRAEEALNGHKITEDELLENPKFVKATEDLLRKAGNNTWTRQRIEEWLYQNRGRLQNKKNVQ